MADGQMTIVGALGRDPELKFTATGRAVTSFTVAVSHRFKQGDDWQEETAWVDVTAWGSLGENIAQSCAKGTRMLVTGRLKQEEWDDKETGKKRTKLSLVADSAGPDLRWATVIVERTERTDSADAYRDGQR